MLTSNILDIAITLGFTFLLLALIVSTVTEIFNTVMQRRSVYLQQGLKALFDNISTNKEDAPVFNAVIESPFIKVLTSEPGWTVKLLAFFRLFKIEDAWFPSYISSNTLSLAVVDVLDIKKLKTIDFENVKKQIEKKLTPGGDNSISGEKKIKDLLLTILDNSVDKDGKFLLTNFTSGIEKTFNDCMDRVTGIYKKKSQWISFILSIIVVLLINVDTLKIVKALQTDKDLLQNAVSVATNSYKQFNPENFSAGTADKQPMNDEAGSLEVISKDSSDTAPDTVISIQKSKNNIKVILNKLNETKIPMGWGDDTIPSLDKISGAFSISILGWLISILAVYLGAPFWFDVLNKFTNIRGAGIKPADTTGDRDEAGSGKK